MSCPTFLVAVCVFVVYIEAKFAPHCSLSLKADFSVPSPVFIYRDDFLTSNSLGQIEISSREPVLVACSGEGRHLVLGNLTRKFQETAATCVSHKKFRTGAWDGRFKDIKCEQHPYFTVENTPELCAGRYNLYRIGYRVLKRFYTLYTACFDNSRLTTLYVKHLVKPGSYYMQQTKGDKSRRPRFVEGELFGKIPIGTIYKTEIQKSRLSTLLGKDMDTKYITKKQFLSRGHLVPRADFPLRAPQRATFHYINAAPQWSRFNAGDWAALEEAIRRRAKESNRTLTVFTGTHKVLTLLNNKGMEEEVYLAKDFNENNIIPVPLYFYKVVYDPLTRRATAFVSINSSYYNSDTVELLTFCKDICEDNPAFAWLKWRKDGTHSFCCDYGDFRKEIKYLPYIAVHDVFS